MRSNIRLGRIAGIELGLHYSWLIIAALITFSLFAHFRLVDPEWSTAVVTAAAVTTGILFFAGLFAHELAHSLVAKAHGIPIRGITLFLFGGMAQIEKEASEAGTEFWIAIAGPLTSFGLGALLLGIALATGWAFQSTPTTPGVAVLVWLGYINVALAVFNLLPGFPMDGGRVLRSAVWKITGSVERATRVAARVGQGFAILLIAYGILRVFAGAGVGGLWLALIGWFLLQAASSSYWQMQSDLLLQGLQVRDVMSRDCTRLPASLSVRQFVDDYLLRQGSRCYIVADDGHMLGLLSPADVRTVDQQRWPQLTVREIMRPNSRVHSVQPETPASEAIEIMARENVNQLPVTEAGELQGMVSRGTVMQVLKSRSELMGDNPRHAA
jgi:Zn-dependent protease/predicted transcriptional regulator